jgi:hypothetical protein
MEEWISIFHSHFKWDKMGPFVDGALGTIPNGHLERIKMGPFVDGALGTHSEWPFGTD